MAAAADLATGAHFAGDEWPTRTYDLVLASSSLQYDHEWSDTLGRLAGVTTGCLLVTRQPIAFDAPSFVVVQRAYGTEYQGWVLNHDDFTATAARNGLVLVREFVISEPLRVPGSPATMQQWGFLFRPQTASDSAV
jgi:putative methyltransferase (TIGR04325 family)